MRSAFVDFGIATIRCSRYQRTTPFVYIGLITDAVRQAACSL
jgi:hypothetical protein